MKRAKKSKGFTLVEIMIVVAIIGLLAAIAVPNFVQARNSARSNTCINNLRIIDASKQQYAIENNAADTATPNSTDCSPYLKNGAFPVCPSTATSYTLNAVSALPTCAAAAGTAAGASPKSHRLD